MPDEIAKEIAASQRGLVIAPAGCGKTHLISEAVKHCNGRQLILTHTHAGVKAIRDKMGQLGVPKDRYRVSTIDSLALRYAAAFPTLSKWTIRRPENEQWGQLRPAAIEVLSAGFAEKVLRASYEGVFVDEYQDCTVSQHIIILRLASILPCRILGDDLQAIFWEINRKSGEALNWAQVENEFPLIGELREPHRWINKNGEKTKNEELGRWLLIIREKLKNGEEIDFRDAPGIDVQECDPDMNLQRSLCQSSINSDGSLVGLMRSREACYQFARKLNDGLFNIFEDAQCVKLMEWSRMIEESEGIHRVEKLKGFVLNWLVGFPTDLPSVFDAVIREEAPRERRPDMTRLYESLIKVRDNADSKEIYKVLDALDSLQPKVVMISQEVWEGLRYAASLGTSLHQAAWDHREQIRQRGRNPSKRCLSTPLLVKGLEFDHALIFNAADFPTVESLYVCLTRASTSIRILSNSSKIRITRAVC